jgi:hypothetical protein
MNCKQLKEPLKKFKEERDRVEEKTESRPQIDQNTQMFMQKVPNSWINKGRDIDEERFSKEVDHNSQFTHPVEHYEINREF